MKMRVKLAIARMHSEKENSGVWHSGDAAKANAVLFNHSNAFQVSGAEFCGEDVSVFFGASAENHLRLQNAGAMDKHAFLRVRNGQVELHTLVDGLAGKSDQAFVVNKAVHRELKTDDTFNIGTFKFTVTISAE